MEKKMDIRIWGFCGSFPKQGDPNIDPQNMLASLLWDCQKLPITLGNYPKGFKAPMMAITLLENLLPGLPLGSFPNLLFPKWGKFI